VRDQVTTWWRLVASRAAASPDAVMLRDDLGRSLTFAEYAERAERVAAALREAAEECGVPADAVTVRGIFDDDHGGWAYRTVFASAPAPFPVFPDSDETDEAAWAPADQVARADCTTQSLADSSRRRVPGWVRVAVTRCQLCSARAWPSMTWSVSDPATMAAAGPASTKNANRPATMADSIRSERRRSAFPAGRTNLTRRCIPCAP